MLAPDKKKLSKLRMPERKPDADLDLGAELGDEDQLPPDEADMEGSADEEAAESPAEESQELEHVPDEALLAELKKRGLMSKLAQDEDSHALMA